MTFFQRLFFTLCATCATGCLSASATAAVPIATLVLRGGKIATMDKENPLAEAVAIRDDRILTVGSNKDVAKHIHDRTAVIELDGKFVMPGFIEGHGHFFSLGFSKMQLDLSRAANWEEVVEMVKAAAKTTPRGNWIRGRGWHQSKWKPAPEKNVDGYPLHDKLSDASPDHPVLLTHASGHMCLANARAMQLASVSANSRSPGGGEILKDDAGKPTGVFRETAVNVIWRAYNRSQQRRTAEQVRNDWRTAVRLAIDECLSNGVTTFHDAGSSFADVDYLKQLADNDELKVRLWVMLDEDNDALARRMADYRLIGYGKNHLTVRGIKRMIDGALGTHGAWLFEPYDDLPSSRGHNTLSIASLKRTAELAIAHEFQLCVHAIGDRANREVLNVFEEASKTHADKTDLRWRVEHAQHLHPDDIPRFKELNVIASMQGIHCTSDAPFVPQRLGMRRSKQGAYVWQSLLKSGAVVINGTDTPVEQLNPLACFHASVTRQLASGVEFFPEQRMTRQQALESYTRSAAHAGFEEQLKGIIAPGKLADLVVLSQDLLTVPDERLLDAKVVYTIVGGETLYQHER